MEKKNLTIKDIARLSGVSPAAVSFAINGRNGISPETRKKIQGVIKETGFHPSMAPRRLTSHKSYNIAIIYPTEASPFESLFYYEVAQGLTEELTRAGFNVVLVPLEMEDNAYAMPKIIRRKDTDGAIFLYDMPKSLMREIEGLGLPYVLVDWQSEGSGGVCVELDCEKSIVSAMNYLFEKGHREIGFVGSDDLPVYYLRCFKSYQGILAEKRLQIYPNWVQSEVHDVENAVACLERIFSLPQKPTALCCSSDMCAIRIIQAAGNMNIKIPEELSLISIDDIILSRYVFPPLTTVSYDKEYIGRTSAGLLLKLMDGEKAENIVIRRHTVVERMSVREISVGRA